MKWLLIALLLLTTTASAENYFTMALGGTSNHIDDGFTDFDGKWKPFNESHNLLGFEYRNTDYGVGVITFKNSYYDKSYMLTASKYWKHDYFEVIASAGAVTGYKNRGGCIIPMVNLCGIVALGVELNTPYIKPRLTWYGTALVLTATLKF